MPDYSPKPLSINWTRSFKIPRSDWSSIFNVIIDPFGQINVRISIMLDASAFFPSLIIHTLDFPFWTSFAIFAADLAWSPRSFVMVTRLESSLAELFIVLWMNRKLNLCPIYSYGWARAKAPPGANGRVFSQKCAVWYTCNTMQRTKKQGPG